MSENQGIPAKHRPIPYLRWWIGGLLFLSTVINFIDRQTLSALAPFLKEDYHWTNEDYACQVLIKSCHFTLPYSHFVLS